jgi:hypothetical protein
VCELESSGAVVFRRVFLCLPSLSLRQRIRCRVLICNGGVDWKVARYPSGRLRLACMSVAILIGQTSTVRRCSHEQGTVGRLEDKKARLAEALVSARRS